VREELSEDAVAAALDTQWIGRTYTYLQRTGSTNDLLKKMIEEGDPNAPPGGTVILTDYQQGGRGRFDRTWEAPPQSSLLFSLLLRPHWPAEQLSWLSMLAGLAVAEAIEQETGVDVYLKWPNDVVLSEHGQWAKVCGVLLEGAISAEERLEYAVLGIGINVNMTANELPQISPAATSLLLATGYVISRRSLFCRLLKRIEQYYEAADGGDSPHAGWNERLITLGQSVEVRYAGQEKVMRGLAEDTDPWGQLVVRDDTGKRHLVMAADVTLSGAD
jgi:BirA family biotin operon repressor/biotin-[acetyl-CoA-carboxylase] ligase